MSIETLEQLQIKIQGQIEFLGEECHNFFALNSIFYE
jgi:hypothetical protein